MGKTTRELEQSKQIRSTDAKGRVALPRGFMGSLVEIEQIDEHEVRIRKVVTIPEREAWLWRNPKALGAVMEGLEEAKAGELGPGPDMAAIEAEFGPVVDDMEIDDSEG